MNLSSNNNSPCVFILDDDKFYLEYIKSIIATHAPNIVTHTFSNKNDLLRNLSVKPDLIILDYNLGMENSNRITAHTVIEDIENNNPNQHIVLLSGEATLPLLEEYSRYRNLDYLVKNDNTVNDLVKIINKKITIHA